MKRIKNLFANVGKMIAAPFIMVGEVIVVLFKLLTESPEEADERERWMLHDENPWGL